MPVLRKALNVVCYFLNDINMRQKTFLLLSFLGSFQLCISQTSLSHGEHFALINGNKIHYYVDGKGPVCLVPSPGWGISVDYLKNTLNGLGKYFTTVFYDTRHSGLSTGPEDSSQYQDQNFVDDMDGLRLYLKRNKVWIAGHSAGAHIALSYAIKHSDKLFGVLCIDGIAGADSIWEANMNQMIEKRKNLPFYKTSINVLLGSDTTKHTAKQTMDIILPYYFHDFKKAAGFNDIAQFKFDDQVAKYVSHNTYWMHPIFSSLSKISVPVIVLVGDDDFICDQKSQADRIVKNINDAIKITVPNAGHFSWYENPKVFYGKLGNWLLKHNVKKQDN